MVQILERQHLPMDGVRFFENSRTVNEGLIVGAIKNRGECLFYATESALANLFDRWEGACYYADILAVFRKDGREHLVGVEVKDWSAKLTYALCKDYMRTYGRTCEYFYIAGRRFSPKIYAIPKLGLIDLDKLEVVREAKYLRPDKKLRIEAVRTLKRWKGAPSELQEDSWQMRLERWG